MNEKGEQRRGIGREKREGSRVRSRGKTAYGGAGGLTGCRRPLTSQKSSNSRG